MKFGQLIESNMRNIFLEKSYKNVVEKLLDIIKMFKIQIKKYGNIRN